MLEKSVDHTDSVPPLCGDDCPDQCFPNLTFRDACRGWWHLSKDTLTHGTPKAVFGVCSLPSPPLPPGHWGFQGLRWQGSLSQHLCDSCVAIGIGTVYLLQSSALDGPQKYNKIPIRHVLNKIPVECLLAFSKANRPNQYTKWQDNVLGTTSHAQLKNKSFSEKH